MFEASSEVAEGLPAELPAAFMVSQLAALDLSRSKLRRWLEEGLVERVGRGAYVRADAAMMDLDRLEVALRVPRATICLVSGLVEHDLVDDNPGVLDLALPRGLWQPALSSPVRWHSFAADTFDLDRVVVPLGPGSHSGWPVSADSDSGEINFGVYGPRRCIIDAFRLRHEVGPEVGIEALRRWLRRPGSNPGDLLSLAGSFPASMPALTAALQVLLE